MTRFMVNATEQQHTSFKRFAVGRGGMSAIILRLIGAEMWEHGELFPGYEPDECHLCSYPIEQHTLHAATATEPGGMECPSPDDNIPF
jgi:hypothetical protein